MRGLLRPSFRLNGINHAPRPRTRRAAINCTGRQSSYLLARQACTHCACAECLMEMMAVCKLAFAPHASLSKKHQVQRPIAGTSSHVENTCIWRHRQRDPPWVTTGRWRNRASMQAWRPAALVPIGRAESAPVGAQVVSALRPYPLHLTMFAFTCKHHDHVVDSRPLA